jgi:hypothetical protein
LWNDIILEEIIMKPIITPASETPAVTRTVAARETEPEVEEEGQPQRRNKMKRMTMMMQSKMKRSRMMMKSTMKKSK